MLLKLWIPALVSVVSAAAKESYDYIIVGGGAAGLALATRLSIGLPSSQILILEAGPAPATDELRIAVPGMRGSGLGSIYDWNFTTTLQPKIGNRSIDVNRGKVLGGSAALNYLCYDRAASAEYDAWGELVNDTKRWNWDVMISAMLKAENFTGEDGDKHGRAGPIRTTYNRIVPEALGTWKPTLSKLGVPINDGRSLGGKPVGVMYQPTNIDVTGWTRSNSATGYLPLAGPNLEVRTGVRVAKVDFAPGSKPLRATGITLENGAKLTARREVILSAGAIQSPGLLELSGIGQHKVLGAANISTLRELPGVGENYQDHIRMSNVYRLRENYTSFDPMIYESGGPFATEQMRLWLEGKVSWYDYTSTAYSFLNWGHLGNSSETDLLRLARNGAHLNNNPVNRKKLDFLKDPSVPQLEIIMESNFVGSTAYPGNGRFATLITSVMHPMSRGWVHIDPAQPQGKPVIDPQYLSHAYDLQALVEGAKFARRIAQTKPMADIWAAEVEPGPAVQTDAQWREFATQAMGSFFHPAGTCAMLPESEGGVVGADLVVYGTENLRVVDCSVMPVLLSAHIQTAAYGIAEVAAEAIIADAKRAVSK
ncbi:hypothetical protein B0H67DRAFT_632509 [Lasiosphaeris hirsuta]|uniref:Glucose-methanol-choline oxidoreductase N-terminal domain-containing protein n=1 Tax=Lasiosphaeris hirsuta TaxID=260670 RepID=A0AA40E5Y2_9PEZI|nr:hypothetical protein B0H67DRAFT_632509 [Lasiosphaeris hirsuta]